MKIELANYQWKIIIAYLRDREGMEEEAEVIRLDIEEQMKAEQERKEAERQILVKDYRENIEYICGQIVVLVKKRTEKMILKGTGTFFGTP